MFSTNGLNKLFSSVALHIVSDAGSNVLFFFQSGTDI